MKVLKELVNLWRTEAKSPTLVSNRGAQRAYNNCAAHLEIAMESKLFPREPMFVKGNGVGLPHGTVAWVVVDGRRYIREWHPMQPDKSGKQLGNWWDLEGGRNSIDLRFSEHEVSHYCVISVPDLPSDTAPSPVPIRMQRPEGGPVEIQAVVGKSMLTGYIIAFTILADLREGKPVLVEVAAETEEEALYGLQLRVDAVLRTFFHSYKTVKI